MGDQISRTEETMDAHVTAVRLDFSVRLPDHVDRGPSATRGPNDTSAFAVPGEVPARPNPRWVGNC
jgi:hypothetical protein